MPSVSVWPRRLRRGTLALVGVLTLLWFSLTAPIDYQPHWKAPGFIAAREAASRTNDSVGFGPLMAGFGRASITPKLDGAVDDSVGGVFPGLPLAGYGGRRGAPATGSGAPIQTKAVAVRVGNRTGVFIAADMLIIPREVAQLTAETLKREHGLAREQIYFSATHTHCGPGGWAEGVVGELFAGEYRPGVCAWLARQMTDAAGQALRDLQPASFGYTHFAAPTFTRNRVVGKDGRVNDRFHIAVFQQHSGPQAVLGAFAAHATVFSDRMMQFHGDYPGVWQQALEEAGVRHAVFLAGAVGSHSPTPTGDGAERVQNMGRALAELVRERLAAISLTNQVAFGMAGVDLNLPDLQLRFADQRRLRPWLARTLLPPGNTAWLQAWRLGNTVWFGTPCDFSGELALDLQHELATRGDSAVITSFNGDYVGYVIPLRYYHLDGYEPRTMSFYGPTIPESFLDLMRAMERTLRPTLENPTSF